MANDSDDELEQLFNSKIRSDKQLLEDQSRYEELFKRFEGKVETEEDGLDWDVLLGNAEKQDKENESEYDELWTDSALKNFVDDSMQTNEPYVSTFELMHWPAKKQKKEIEKIVKDKPWLNKAIQGYQVREQAAIRLDLKYFTVEETEEVTEDVQLDQIELKENYAKLTSQKTIRTVSRKRLVNEFSASAEGSYSSSSSGPSALPSSSANPLGVSQLRNILSGHTLQFPPELQKQMQQANSNQSMNINHSIQINFVLGKDTEGIGEFLKEIHFDADSIKSQMHGIKDRVVTKSRLQALQAPVVVKQEPMETIELDDETDDHDPQKMWQDRKKEQDDSESELSDDFDSDFPRKANKSLPNAQAGNSKSNLTLPLANFKLNDTVVDPPTTAAAAPSDTSIAVKKCTQAEIEKKFKNIFGDEDDETSAEEL